MNGVSAIGQRSSCEGAASDIAMEGIVLPVGEFDLEATLESGQCFRWRRVGEREYIGVIGRSVVHVRHIPMGHGRAGALAVRVVGGIVPDHLEALIIHYFDLARDYRAPGSKFQTVCVRVLRRASANCAAR